ncbi:MAG: 50S ribosomal protein L29 [Syntrophomonadaceae bacterium]|jgi:large subunit ribosomal protein L29|nr:50S ribosomal protein L29 [Syntrophomonadaceae bacterium]
MKLNEIKDLSTTELERKVDDLKQELFNLRFQLATGQLDNPMRIRMVRHNIAQTKTVLRERQLKETKRAQ